MRANWEHPHPSRDRKGALELERRTLPHGRGSDGRIATRGRARDAPSRSRLGLARDRNVTQGTVLRAGPAVTIGDIMVPLREWLRPPKGLLLILVLLSLVSVSAVGWFGFKLLEQDRMVQAQRRQERLEQAADRVGGG